MFERFSLTVNNYGKWVNIFMMNSKKVILLEQVFKKAIIIFINYVEWTLMQTIDFILHSSTTEHTIKGH